MMMRIVFVLMMGVGIQAYNPDLRGVTINLLTEKDTIIHNPAYWADEFTNRTGARVNLIGLSQGEMHPEIMAAARDRVNYYDLFIYAGQRIVDYVHCTTCDEGYQSLFEDLTDWVPQQPEIVWPDIAYYIRSYVGQYNGRIYAIPLDGDVHYLYTNTELLGRYANGAAAPKTWDEFNTVAAQIRDGLLANGVNDTWAVCLAKSKNHVWPWYTFTFISPYIQSLGTQQGVFFDPDTFEPLLNNEGVREALEQMRRTNDFGPSFQFDLTVDRSRTMFKNGQCAMTVDWGDIILLSNKSTVTHGKVQVTRTPGTTRVWDRHTHQLRTCDSDLCPYATDGINYASMAATGGWVAAVNRYSTGLRKQAALEFLKLIGSQRASNIDVTRGFGLDMCRVGQMKSDFWIANGFSQAQAEATVGAVRQSLTGPNTVNDLRIPRNWDYEFGALDGPVQRFLAGNQTAQQAIDTIVTGWNTLTSGLGLNTQLDIYRRTLGLPPRTRFDCSRRGCNLNGGRCVADDICLCNDGWTGDDCAGKIAVQALDLGDPVAGVVLGLAALGVVSTLGLMAFLVQYGSDRVVKAKSPTLMLYVGMGLVVGFTSVLCSIGIPTVASCALEPVMLAASSALILCVLVAKTYRIKKIFHNPKLVVVAMRNGHVLRIAALLAVPNLILALLLVVVQTPHPIVRLVGQSRFWTCQADLPAQIALKSLLLAYNFLVLAFGVVLAFQTRHVISEFNESKSIGDAVYVITFGTAIIFPLSFARLDLVVMTSLRLLITLVSLILVEILLIGKILFQFLTDRDKDSKFSHADGATRGGSPITESRRRKTITAMAGAKDQDQISATRLDGHIFTVPLMRTSAWMPTWVTGTVMVVPARDLFAVITHDGVGYTYQLSSMSVVKEPPLPSPELGRTPEEAQPVSYDVSEQRMFEIAFDSVRFRIDGLTTPIWDILSSTSGIPRRVSTHTRNSGQGKNAQI